mgnify:FL=1|jgi:hypothetical protein
MNTVILALLIMNVLFWSFFPHSAHCYFLDGINSTFGSAIKCPEHSIHLLMGIVAYFLALYYAQMNYINKKLF